MLCQHFIAKILRELRGFAGCGTALQDEHWVASQGLQDAISILRDGHVITLCLKALCTVTCMSTNLPLISYKQHFSQSSTKNENRF